MKESLLHALRLAQKNAAAIYESRLPPGCKVTLPQSEVLLAVSRAGRCSQTFITEQTGIDRSTLSKMMVVLCARKWVTSDVPARDERENEVCITDLGRVALRHALSALDAAEDHLLRHVPGGKRKLMAALGAIVDV